MRVLIAGLVAAAALSASGCLSVLPQPVIPLALISLPADRAVAPAGELLTDVAVYLPEASRAFAGTDIAVRDAQELVYLADVRWADPAPQLLQGAVVNALSLASGPGRAVVGQIGAEVDYDVRWRIVDISAGRETAPVRVAVQVNLLDSLTRRTVAQEDFATEATPTDRAPRARAAALALATQKIADDVAAFVARTAIAK